MKSTHNKLIFRKVTINTTVFGLMLQVIAYFYNIKDVKQKCMSDYSVHYSRCLVSLARIFI